MKAIFAFLLAISTAFSLASCGGGSSATPPANVTLVPGDGIITVTWDMAPGVEYWLFSAAADSITTSNWNTLPNARAFTAVSSPYVLTGVYNGTTYSVTINGRTNGGPGGTGSPSVSVTPRIAGFNWDAGASTGTSDLRGVAYAATISTAVAGKNVLGRFAAVGANGVIFTSTDGKSWTAESSGVPTTTLNAVTFGAIYLAVGEGGTVLASSDAIAWSKKSSGTTNNLNSVTANGSFYVAVGDSGTIITSSGGDGWTVQTPVTSENLYGVDYVVDHTGVGRYVAVGANGALLTSTDAATWTLMPNLTSQTLRGIAHGAGTFVVLGDAGTVLTSADTATSNWQWAWAAQPPIASNPAINSVIYASQFVAVGNAGAIFTSTNGIDWSPATSVSPANSNDLHDIVFGSHGYISVGSVGANLTSY